VSTGDFASQQVADSATLSAFMNHVNSNLARLLGDLCDCRRRGRFGHRGRGRHFLNAGFTARRA